MLFHLPANAKKGNFFALHSWHFYIILDIVLQVLRPKKFPFFWIFTIKSKFEIFKSCWDKVIVPKRTKMIHLSWLRGTKTRQLCEEQAQPDGFMAPRALELTSASGFQHSHFAGAATSAGSYSFKGLTFFTTLQFDFILRLYFDFIPDILTSFSKRTVQKISFCYEWAWYSSTGLTTRKCRFKPPFFKCYFIESLFSGSSWNTRWFSACTSLETQIRRSTILSPCRTSTTPAPSTSSWECWARPSTTTTTSVWWTWTADLGSWSAATPPPNTWGSPGRSLRWHKTEKSDFLGYAFARFQSQ